MCLAVPGRVTAVEAGDDPLRRLGTVDFQGTRVEVMLALTPEAAVGDWVLVHAGFAISRLDEADARETWEYLREAEFPGCRGEFPGIQSGAGGAGRKLPGTQSAAGNPKRGGAGRKLPGIQSAAGNPKRGGAGRKLPGRQSAAGNPKRGGAGRKLPGIQSAAGNPKRGGAGRKLPGDRADPGDPTSP